MLMFFSACFSMLLACTSSSIDFVLGRSSDWLSAFDSTKLHLSVFMTMTSRVVKICGLITLANYRRPFRSPISDRGSFSNAGYDDFLPDKSSIIRYLVSLRETKRRPVAGVVDSLLLSELDDYGIIIGCRDFLKRLLGGQRKLWPGAGLDTKFSYLKDLYCIGFANSVVCKSSWWPRSWSSLKTTCDRLTAHVSREVTTTHYVIVNLSKIWRTSPSWDSASSVTCEENCLLKMT